jgi:HSP20 family molecular chaperone IbpA
MIIKNPRGVIMVKVLTAIVLLLLQYTLGAQGSDVKRFGNDESEVKQLYDALSRGRIAPQGARPNKGNQEKRDQDKGNQDQLQNNKSLRLKDVDPNFANPGDWENAMMEQMLQMRRQMLEMFKGLDDNNPDFFQAPDRGHRPFGLGRKLLEMGDDSDGVITSTEDAKSTIYKIDLSKIDPNSLKIDIKQGQLRITGQSKIEKREETAYGSSSSISISSFDRSYPIPKGVKEGQVKVEQKDKLIEIIVPKG